MGKEFGRDLIINGTGSSIGGQYENIKIRGEGRVSGDIESNLLRVSGTSDFNGSVKTKVLEINGTSVIAGAIETDRMKINGTCNNTGDLSCKELNLRGVVDCDGNFNGEQLHIFGVLNVKGDCAAEVFHGRGAFSVGGLLSADSIEIGLSHTDSQAKEIGGEKIQIKRVGSAFGLGKILRPIKLIADTIEGDDIYLEYTKSNVVRGNNVSIGPGCEIETVEYKNNFTLAKGAKVKSNKKV